MSGSGTRARLAISTALISGMFMNMLQAQIRVEPPNWWTGMHNPSLQIMLHGEGLASYNPKIEYPGVILNAWHPGSSPNYLFVDLEIETDAAPGTLLIQLQGSGKEDIEIRYDLRQRDRKAEDFLGFDSGDAVYLITPDRFANGDPSNDVVSGLRETTIDRKDDYGRHGGDIRGIIQGLDYMADMGFTALWSCPLLINDMPEASYHGYAITDYYQVDPRFGTLEEYLELSQKAREKGIKLIMDQVVNHCGLHHWWMEDLPFEDWIHYQQDWLDGKPFTVTNHRRTVNQDPYASQEDQTLMNQGWFVPSMPDLNQDNPFLGTYLIQNSIWWIETLALGGIRQDTYPYPDKHFMARWARSIMEEYPNFNIVGEEWSYNPLLVGYWQHGAHNRDAYQSYLRTTMDFPLQRTLVRALKAEEKWDTGFNELYEALANDLYYARPRDIMMFGDNHDMDRLFTQVGESVELAEMALAYICTVPRIPQIYYGTEILMQNTDKPGDHGLIRTDFPGGWEDASVNAFTGEGLSPSQRQMQQRLRRLLRFRRGSTAMKQGETVHFAPEDGVYVLARKEGAETVVLVLNKNEEEVLLNLDRFQELGLSGPLHEVLRDQKISWGDSLLLRGKGAYLLASSLNPEPK